VHCLRLETSRGFIFELEQLINRLSGFTMSNKSIKPEKISIKNHPELVDTWIHELIAGDPNIIGLGYSKN